MTNAPTVPTRAYLAAFFSRVEPTRARLMFAIDATASREPTWDMASSLTAQMFDAVAGIGGLAVQLVHYRGRSDFVASRWMSDPRELAAMMSRVMCRSGLTQIGKVITHAHAEGARNKLNAVVLVSDACEENPAELYAAACRLKTPVFAFQEGDDEVVADIYGQIASRHRWCLLPI